jgi:tetratricopeptide (TPR) repeat protein
MSATYDASKELVRSELASRIRECLVLRDWARMEHWARQWMQLEPRNPNAFKWLARASVGLKRMQKASYAYGRVLDFDPTNEEALKFFKEYPSTITQDGVSPRIETPSAPHPKITSKILASKILDADEMKVQTLTRDKRALLAEKTLEMGDLYYSNELYARAAQIYKESFDWHQSAAAALGAARSFHLSNQSHHAVHFLKQTLLSQRNWIEGRLLLGKILFEIGQTGEAQREWQLVLKQEPDNREALNFIRHLMDHR